MVRDLSEEDARRSILKHVREYCEQYHTNKKKWTEGDRINYASRVYDAEEMVNLVDSALEFWLTSGRYTERFEKEFADFLGVKYCSVVNSGSSANLLAFMALTSPLLGDRKIEYGDEVITVAAGFPTTIAPIVQYGAVPVFVDITVPQYNIDVEYLEKAYSNKTRAVMIAHTLGNPFDIRTVREFCKRHSLWLIEDNCDALGSQVEIDGKTVYTGTIGDIGTSSFYPPHHMTMGEGGAVYTNDALLNKIIRSLRDWGRDCICPSGNDNLCGHRFDRQYGELPVGYDHKYVYSHMGYNLKATDMQAAVGCAQLKKLPDFISGRRRNFEYINKRMKKMEHCFLLPEALEHSMPSWFGYMLTCRKGIDKNRVVSYLEANNVQTRMLFAGNIIKQPCFNEMRTSGRGYRVVGQLTNTNFVMENSFWIGVYPGMTEEMMEYVVKLLWECAKWTSH